MRKRCNQKVAFLNLGILLTIGILLLFQPELISAEGVTHSVRPSQPVGAAQVARNLVGIAPLPEADLLTVNLIFDGRLPIHNPFILSNPPRFVVELMEVGSTLEESALSLEDDRVKRIAIQRHPGKLHVIFYLTSLDGISYYLKAEDNRIVASLKIYAEQPSAQPGQFTDSAPVTFSNEEPAQSHTGAEFEEDPKLTPGQEDTGIDTGSDAKQEVLDFQKEKDDLADEEGILQSELDAFSREPSILNPKLNAFIQELTDGYSYEIRALANQRVSDLGDSPINPLNVIEIPKYTFSIELRPDFYLNYRKLKLMAKPRGVMTWTRIEDGFRDGESDWDDELFMNEWLAGLQPISSLFVSYGRENLQWGPSYLISPSNPFFRDNGLSNPKLEIRGQDFARMVWVPSMSWSFSAIANTGKGANDLIEDFEPAYALKVDYTGYRKYFSIIPSYREEDRARLGAFAGWTVMDGLLLYTEATASQGTDVLYPVPTGSLTDSGVPVVTLEATEDDSNSIETIALFGASYTFELGPTLTLEYLYNGPGYDDDQIDSLLDFTSDLENVIAILPPYLINRFFDLENYTDLGLALLRQHYLNFQYQHQQIWEDLSLGLRYTFNLNDQSSQLIPFVQYDLNDNLQVFFVGTQNFGDKRGEFRLFVENSYFFGLQYTF